MAPADARAYLATLYLLGWRGDELKQALGSPEPGADAGAVEAMGIHSRLLDKLTSGDREARAHSVAPILRELTRALEARSYRI